MDIRTLYRASNQVAALLLLAVLCLGIAWLAVLPPWEGFDETAHWSYIQQLSDTGKAPRYGVDHLAADVDAYRGPMRYGETPPFEKTGHMTYREAGRASLRGGLGGPTTYRQGRSLNWQSQHPPLYYIVMGAAYRLTRTLGWVPHLFVLRLTSFLASILRSQGGSCVSYDPFADGARDPMALGPFDLITAFEVFEHVTDVGALMSRLVSLRAEDGIILFSTLTSDGHIHAHQRLDWWYASPRNGHISLFSKTSLSVLATRYSFNFGTLAEGVHVFWKKAPPFAAHLFR